MSHHAVLLQEAVASLAIVPNDTVVDMTMGSGGHFAELYRLHGKHVKLIGLDTDFQAMERVRNLMKNAPEPILLEGNFRDIDKVLGEISVFRIDKALFDLGWSTDQFETSHRGFSWKYDEPLDMRFSPRGNPVSAYIVVNHWSQETLETIIKGFGEERFARSVSRAIIEAREKQPIETSGQLAEIITNAVPSRFRHSHLHPATKTFQAIRIAVNDELGALQIGLAKTFELLNAKGRIAVISFHSLEDRIVKHFYKKQVALGRARLVSKKPITPGEEELAHNRRARSAKLRVIEKSS